MPLISPLMRDKNCGGDLARSDGLKSSLWSLQNLCSFYGSVIDTSQWALMPCGWKGNRIGLPSHWPCITDINGSPPYGLKAYEREMSTRLQ